MTITVTWMDGLTENYPCESYRVEAGVLYLFPRRPTQDPKRGIPLHNVRIFTE